VEGILSVEEIMERRRRREEKERETKSPSDPVILHNFSLCTFSNESLNECLHGNGRE
jgi:hypothetical protein